MSHLRYRCCTYTTYIVQLWCDTLTSADRLNQLGFRKHLFTPIVWEEEDVWMGVLTLPNLLNFANAVSTKPLTRSFVQTNKPTLNCIYNQRKRCYLVGSLVNASIPMLRVSHLVSSTVTRTTVFVRGNTESIQMMMHASICSQQNSTEPWLWHNCCGKKFMWCVRKHWSTHMVTSLFLQNC